jgi:hypothetical protein
MQCSDFVERTHETKLETVYVQIIVHEALTYHTIATSKTPTTARPKFGILDSRSRRTWSGRHEPGQQRDLR